MTVPASDDLRGKVALVTGASRGIGKAIAHALAAQGCRIAVNCRSGIDAAQEVVDACAQQGVQGLAVAADVGEEQDVARMFEACASRLGAPDIVVNNAGGGSPAGFDELSLDDWNAALRLNLTSAFLVTKAALPAMRSRHWGRIVNMSSAAAQTGGLVGPHYAASKAGLLGLTRSTAQRHAAQGITANAILPSLIDTDMVRSRPDLKPDRIPVQRFGRTQELAEFVVAVVRNGYLTGQCLHLNGGSYFA